MQGHRLARAIVLSLLGLLSGPVGPGLVLAQGNGDTSSLERRFEARLEKLQGDLVEVRRDLHRNPELSGEEIRTAALVAGRLEELGFEVRTAIGGTGVVGVLHGERPGPLVAFRADMDAVASHELDPVEFRSQNLGVRHICGHDIHTTIGLALAEGFTGIVEELPGSLMLIFQPAEETATGARAMVGDAVFGQRLPVAIYALHTAPLEVGQLATSLGTLMAGRDLIEVSAMGDGNLEAAARRVREQLLGASTVQGAGALEPHDDDFVLVQVAEVEEAAGGGLTVRAAVTTPNARVSARAREDLERRLAALELDGVALWVDFEPRFIAGVTNDEALTRQAIASAERVVGPDSVMTIDSMVPAFSEDFGTFQQLVPGTMFFLGVSNAEKGWVGMPHSPDYVADEEAIFVGARVMAAVILDRMAPPADED